MTTKHSSIILTVVLPIILCCTPATASGTEEGLSLGHTSSTTPVSTTENRTVGALTAKYSFMLSKDLMPYIGSGIAYSLPPQGKPGDQTPMPLKTGIAAQAGFRFSLSEHSDLNVDYTYLRMQQNQTRDLQGPNPQMLGIGLGIKF